MKGGTGVRVPLRLPFTTTDVRSVLRFNASCIWDSHSSGALDNGRSLSPFKHKILTLEDLNLIIFLLFAVKITRSKTVALQYLI